MRTHFPLFETFLLLCVDAQALGPHGGKLLQRRQVFHVFVHRLRVETEGCVALPHRGNAELALHAGRRLRGPQREVI